MNFTNPLDEFSHYVRQLALDVALGVDRRHLLSTSRLCFLLIERIDAADPKSLRTLNVAEFKALEIQLLDLQRAISKQAEPVNPNPVARRVGRLRVIEGGT